MTLLFLGLFGGALQVPEGTTCVDFLIPGMLAVTMLFGLETTTLAAAADAARGVNDRFRSFPINAASIALGRCMADMIGSLVSLAAMVSCGLVIGWRPVLSPGSALAAIALLLLLRLSLLWIGLSVGYGADSVESVAYVQVLVWPIAFFSSVFVNAASMPAWLGTIAELNPVSATATAVRGLLGGDAWPTLSVAGECALGLALVWPLLLTAIFLPLAARRYQDGDSDRCARSSNPSMAPSEANPTWKPTAGAPPPALRSAFSAASSAPTAASGTATTPAPQPGTPSPPTTTEPLESII